MGAKSAVTWDHDRVCASAPRMIDHGSPSLTSRRFSCPPSFPVVIRTAGNSTFSTIDASLQSTPWVSYAVRSRTLGASTVILRPPTYRTMPAVGSQCGMRASSIAAMSSANDRVGA
jgi:hypothetical protein